MYRAGLVVLIVCSLAGCLVATPAVSPSDMGAASLDAQSASLAGTQQSFDQTVFEVHVFENGSAEWTFAYRRGLANETERQQFEDFAQRFNTEETELYTDFQTRANTLTDQGSQVTGRSMTASNFDREARVGSLGNQGIVEMSFLWEGFAVVGDEQVSIGDVFDGGLYVGQNQRLVVTWNDPLTFESATPDPDATNIEDASSPSITWEGERQFNDGRPQVILSTAPDATPGQTETATDSGDGGAGDGGAGDGGDGSDGGATPTDTPAENDTPLLMIGLGAALLVGLIGGAAYLTGAVGGTQTSDDSEGGVGGAATAPSPEPAVSDEELMSDEDRVMGMLEENGGRMKQVNIVDESGWSKSKVSMLLSEMEEEGLISKLRVGRENIISKKGAEPEGARSPFDDDE